MGRPTMTPAAVLERISRMRVGGFRALRGAMQRRSAPIRVRKAPPAFLRCALVGALTAITLGLAPEASAQPLRLAVVVDGAAGVQHARAVREIRETLTRDSGLSTFSLTTLAARRQRPDAVITVSFARRGDVQVMYWDRNGRADSLEAPVPGRGRRAYTAAASLSAALLRRHLPRLRATLPSRVSHDRNGLSWLTKAEIRRMKKRVRRTSELTLRDF